MWRTFLCLLFVIAMAKGQAPVSPPPAPAPPESITIDSTEQSHTFPHFWERIFGSERANVTLRESWRNDLKTVKRRIPVEYVRFHAIFHDDIGLYSLDQNLLPFYNFTYVDQVYDGLLENGVKPFVELSFMPRDLAVNLTPHAFWYKPFPSPPKDFIRWDEMITAFVQHLIDRYGAGEVATWYFEVWNEPNIDFWTGDPKDLSYYDLYDHTARALKAISPRLRIGGPATAQAAWVDRFLDHCAQNKIPVDFVSTHVYGNDSSKDVFGTNETISRGDMVARSAKKVFDQVKKSAFPNIEIHWSEYNASYMNEVAVTDSPYMGPWLARNIALCDGLTTTMSYWTFSDVFEEQGVSKAPFYGGYGLIAAGGIPKSSYNAFALLTRLGFERIENPSPSALITKKGDGALAIALWNYSEAEQEGKPKDFLLDFPHTPETFSARMTLIDQDHGSALRLWQEMGSPKFPSREEQARLRTKAALPEAANIPFHSPLAITLPPKGLALIEISR